MLDFWLKQIGKEPPLPLRHWLLKLFHGGQVDHIDVATDQSLNLSKTLSSGKMQGKNPRSHRILRSMIGLKLKFTCCFPPLKASSKSSLFLDSNLHHPFLVWTKAHNIWYEVDEMLKWSSPSFIKPLPLLFSCINRGCVIQLLTRLFNRVVNI